MKILPQTILPKRFGLAKQAVVDTAILKGLSQAATTDSDIILQQLETNLNGLSLEQVELRIGEYGHNVIVQEKHHSRLKLLARALVNPLVILLSILAVISALTGDYRAAFVMVLMVILGVVLRFLQEARADSAAAKLKAMISVTATVLRDNQQSEVPLSQLVPGDIIKLAAGDMVPADIRLLSCKDLFVIQASLTGESFPVEKFDIKEPDSIRPGLDLKNICFLGTSIESGSAVGVVLTTGLNTYLGSIANTITAQQVQTSFDKGIGKFTWLMIRFMMVMVPLVFLINGLTKHDWHGAFFFALSVAVGMTPEMLPMIVTVCLSKGSIAMSKKKVIVKRLNSIQNFGAMDILCTDKTGTLTLDKVILEKHCNVMREDEVDVLVHAYLNSYFQTGLRNVLDRAILVHKEVHEEFHISDYKKVDEIPFDFSRKVMSVAVSTPKGNHRLICKGAPEEIFKKCSQLEYQNGLYPMERVIVDDLQVEYEELSADGFRVLAIAYKDFEPKNIYSKEDEKDMILRGYVAFLDPPKESAGHAIIALKKHGVSVKVLTGDNELVSKKICKEVGIETENVLTGEIVESMTDAQLAEAVERTTLFARLAPANKVRVIKELQNKGHVVGYLGDGINDAAALRAADVGISVDSAVDIAKESADAILLEKSLMVLEEGVLEGRKVFANIIKYIRMGASSSFGNMFSVVGASAFLPFLPMSPIQILTNNLLYDFSQVAIPTDDVDPEQIAKPRPWSMNEITKFILWIGPCSSIFDYSTYFVMLYIFNCWDPANVRLFQTGWFVESILTQTLIVHVIRTNKLPFIQSRASLPLLITTGLIMAIAAWLPYSPFAAPLGLAPLPGLYWLLMLLTLGCYVVLTQTVKFWLLRKV